MLRWPAFQKAWGGYRRFQLHREYDARREHYVDLARKRGLVYSEEKMISAVRDRLNQRGYIPQPRKVGEIHTFAFIPRIGWHSSLYPDLYELGRVTEFDYGAHGFHWKDFLRADPRSLSDRRAMNDMVLPALRAAHARAPVDWVFVYASGLEISANTIKQITDELGIPTVNMCLDDKQSWAGKWMGDHRAGQVDLSMVFDLAWTSARVACEWYLVEGGRPIYMPEGFDMNTYRPTEIEQDIPVSFIGGEYGYRPSLVRYLRRNGIPVQTFGPGWPGSGWIGDIVEIINRSVINLGMGGIGYSENLTNVKARDFEIPGTGGGAYLTSFNPDLAQHFVIGEEILCYSNRDEMLELIRYYLTHPEEARVIARRGRRRCLDEHRWLHRYQHICRILGILAEDKPVEDPKKNNI